MAKKNTGQRNFFRFMAVIGVVVIGGIVYSFLGAAPKLPGNARHSGPPPPAECLACHVENVDQAPIMPHRPMPSCVTCHKPSA